MSSSIMSLWLLVAMIVSLFSGAVPDAYYLYYKIAGLPEEVQETTLSDVIDSMTIQLPAAEDVAASLPYAIDALALDETAYSAAIRYHIGSASNTLGSVSLTGVDKETVQFALSLPEVIDLTVQADAEGARFTLGSVVYGVKYADLANGLLGLLPAQDAASLIGQYADIPFSVYLEDVVFLTQMLNLVQDEMAAAGFSLRDLDFTNYLSLTLDTVRLKNAMTRIFTQLFAHEEEINGLIDRYGSLFGLREEITSSHLRTQAMRLLRSFSASAEHINLQIVPTSSGDVYITGQYGDRDYGYGATLSINYLSDAQRITGSLSVSDSSESYMLALDLAQIGDMMLAGTVELLSTNYRGDTTSQKLSIELGVSTDYYDDLEALHFSVLPLTPIPGFSGVTANLAITNANCWSANVVSDYFTLDASTSFRDLDFALTLLDELALDAHLTYNYAGIDNAFVGWSTYSEEYTYLRYENNTLTLVLPRDTYILSLMPEENALPNAFAHLDTFRGMYEPSITLASLKQQQNYYNVDYQTNLTLSRFPLYGSHGPMQTISFALERCPIYSGQKYGRGETFSLDLTRTIFPLRQAPAAFDESTIVWLDLPQLVELIDETLNPTEDEATESEATTAEVTP